MIAGVFDWIRHALRPRNREILAVCPACGKRRCASVNTAEKPLLWHCFGCHVGGMVKSLPDVRLYVDGKSGLSYPQAFQQPPPRP